MDTPPALYREFDQDVRKFLKDGGINESEVHFISLLKVKMNNVSRSFGNYAQFLHGMIEASVLNRGQGIGETMKLRQDMMHVGENGEGECAICKEDVRVGATVSQLQCKHWFHSECLERWAQTPNETCPYCRASTQRSEFVRGVSLELEDFAVPGRDPKQWDPAWQPFSEGLEMFFQDRAAQQL